MTDSIKAVEGAIIGGPLVGYRIRAEDDRESSGGYLVIYWNPNNSNEGWDDWVEKFDDIPGLVSFRGHDVEWETPLDALRPR